MASATASMSVLSAGSATRMCSGGPAGTFRSSRCSAPTNIKLLQVRCSSNKDSGSSSSGMKESVDRSTKQEPEAISGKQSVLGTQPPSTAPDRSLRTLFAFDGAAPETINGRMAMVGLVWAALAEKVAGLTVTQQLFSPATSGALWFGVVVQLFTVASIIPFLNGESTDGRRWGPFNARAERWNGRLAMIGFAALLIDEMFRHAPVFHS